MPDVCGRICPQEKLCEGACIVGVKKPPVTTGKLEAFVTDFVRRNYGFPSREVAPPTGMRVAVVGAGPAAAARVVQEVVCFTAAARNGASLPRAVTSSTRVSSPSRTISA